MALDSPFIAFRFEVVLDLDKPKAGLSSPLCEAAFSECDGLELTMQTKTLEVGGVNDSADPPDRAGDQQPAHPQARA